MFEARIQTYWDDSDAAGRVFFAHFFRFVECAETELFHAAGVERVKLCDQYGVWMPRVEAFAKFFQPIGVEQAIIVRLVTQFQREKTVRIDFEILSEPDRAHLAQGYCYPCR